MRLLNTLKSFKILLVVFLMVAVTIANAKVEPTDDDKADNNGQLHKEQVEQDESGSDTNAGNDIAGEKEGASDEDGARISSSSFNYFFYLIYQIKFANIFKLPNRNTEESRSFIPTLNINLLLEKLINPKI
jgi:hypothetical protein